MSGHNLYQLVCILGCVFLASIADGAKPRTPARLRSEGDTAFVSGKTNGVKKALKLYTEAIEMEPNNHNNYYKRYRAWLRLKKEDKALKDLDKAIKVNPDFQLGHKHRGTMLRKKGKCKEAKESLQRAVDLKPADKSAQKELAAAKACADNWNMVEQLKQRGDIRGARDQLDKILETTKANVDLLLARGELSFRMADYPEALADTGRALKIKKNSIAALALRAHAYYNMADLDMAMRHHREGLKYDPEHKAMKAQYKKTSKMNKAFNAAKIHLDRGEVDKALNRYRFCAAVDPANSEFNKQAHSKECELLLKHKKDPKAAMVACEKALSYDGNHGEALILMAKIHDQQENFEEAVRAWTKAREVLGENHAEANDGLGRAETALKQSKEKNYYKILGIPRSADKREIKKAYRALALKWHPDKVSEEDKEKANAMFADIGEAYEVLSDDEKKSKYDRGEEVFENQGGQQRQNNPFHGFPGGGGGQTFTFNFRL